MYFANLWYSYRISWLASKKTTIIRYAFKAITGIIPVISIHIEKEIVDSLVVVVSTHNSFNTFVFFILCQAFILLLNLLMNVMDNLLQSKHMDLISNFIENQFMKKSSKISIAHFDSPAFYNQMISAKRDSIALKQITWTTANIVSVFVTFISSFVILFEYKFYLPLIMLIIMIPSYFNDLKYRNIDYQWYQEKIIDQRKITYYKNLFTSRQSAKDLRLYGIADIFINRHNQLWQTLFKEKNKILKKKAIINYLFALLPILFACLVDLRIGYSVIFGSLTIGSFTYIRNSVSQFQGGLQGLIHSFSSIYEYNIQIENYRTFIEKEESDKTQCSVEMITVQQQKKINFSFIEFKQVYFRYPGATDFTLKNINLKLQRGQSIAIVGLNGAGKTTLVNLLMGFYPPTMGQILIDGIDITKYDDYTIKSMFSAMFQDYANYAFTLRENIALGDMDNIKDSSKMFWAMKKSTLSTSSTKFDDTSVYLTKQFAEDGLELSGGEWQKVALARAIFRDSLIYVFDEPSSHLDPEAEHQLFEIFTTISKDKTAVFISHKLSNITNTDMIYVIQNGSISESGSFEKLIGEGGEFARLYKLQAEKYRGEPN